MPDPVSSIRAIAQSPEFRVGGGDAAPASPGFGKALQGALGKLNDSLQASSQAAESLATGTADDVSSVVMAVERASLELQLASQVRNKAVEAYQEIFRMQV